ncbi:MAG: hypothetical protein R3Y15_03135 [Rikenellaceae bacterium]
MSTFWIVLIIAIVVVGFFVVGMSLTIIFKGHYIDSEIGDNENMKKLGINCASRQMREEELRARGISTEGVELGSCSHSCGSCTEHECVEDAKSN